MAKRKELQYISTDNTNIEREKRILEGEKVSKTGRTVQVDKESYEKEGKILNDSKKRKGEVVIEWTRIIV